MNFNTVTWLSVTDILHNVVSSCDFDTMETPEDWAHMIETKAGDSGFGYLVESIMERGFLEEGSIGICFDGEPEEGNWRITEGHHRLVAAILLCVDEVPTTPYGNSYVGPGSVSAHSGRKSDTGELQPAYGLALAV